ncbi:Glycoside hydrolase superfamily [Penicillium sp. DV-2018c]|nr:Glycoside hydrolase superfamily [Penicillium sp. DV-2018c]
MLIPRCIPGPAPISSHDNDWNADQRAGRGMTLISSLTAAGVDIVDHTMRFEPRGRNPIALVIMRPYQGILSWSLLLASIGGAQAKLDLNSTSNMVVYWGQNSFNGKGDKAQQPLAHYCDNEDIDVIPMAFNMMVNGPGGAPEVDFSVTSKDCEVFEGTQLKNCPKIGKDIEACQKKHKTILLSIGGATYSEGGFKSEADAKEGAKLMWETFGPKQKGSKALRPFGDAALDGFDFDFEANVQHMAPFANELRSLMDADKSGQKFYLTAAPQCPYPDQADKDILNGPVYVDAVWVQFYNNFCGVNAFSSDSSSNKYNFDEWDNWAHTVSKNKDVKVMIGVPAFTTAASTGYIPASELAKVIEYSKKFKSFGGVMMWDATQAYGNDGFIKDVRKSLGPAADDSDENKPKSTTTPAPKPATTEAKPKPTTTTTTKPATTQSKPNPTTTASPKPATTEAKPKPTTTTTPKPATTEVKPTKITTTTKPTAPATKTSEAPVTPTKTAAPPSKGDDENDSDDSDDEDNTLSSVLGNDLMSLLGGLRHANQVAGGVANGLVKGLRHGKRNRV